MTFKKLLNNKSSLFLILIIILGFFLRIYNLNHLYYYTMDEEVMNLIQRRIILGQHYPLIGSVSPLGTYLGPIFYYIGAAVLWISHLNPTGQGYFAAILGTLNILLIYIVCKELFNRKVALFGSIFYSFSFLMILFDRRFWQLTPGPFLSLLVLLSLFKIKQGSIKFIYLLTAALILGWNSDYTNLVLILFTVLAWILFKLPVRRKEVVIAIFIFILSNSPLVFFDLRHNFLNTKAFIGYFTHHTQKLDEGVNTAAVTGDRATLGQTRTDQAVISSLVPIYGFSRLIYTNSDPNIAEQHTYCKEYISDRNQAQGAILPLLATLLIAGFIYIAWRRRKEKDSLSYKLIVSFYLIFQLGILSYAFLLHGDIFEHYIATLMPYFFIMMAVIADIFYTKRFKWIVVFLIGVYVIFNISTVLRAYNPLSLGNDIDAANYTLSEVGNSAFSLDSIGSCFKYSGFYYPFIYLGKHPVKSYQDPNYAWLYDYQVADKHPSRVVVMVSKGKFEDANFNETYQRYQQWVINRKQFGGIEVLILDNSKGDFH